MPNQPHSSWATVYDQAYELSFGQVYTEFTERTLDLIVEVSGPNGSVIDFGAGTGRLTLPLLDRGYQVTAVEVCQEMADQLSKKRNGKSLELHVSKMADFQPSTTYDMALCVFTVIAYILDRDELVKSLSVAYSSLKPTGMLLLEIPSIELFRGHSVTSNDMTRAVNVEKLSPNKFHYMETIECLSDSGQTETIRDSFTIQYWPREDVLKIINDIGFTISNDHAESLARLGQGYYLLRKA